MRWNRACARSTSTLARRTMAWAATSWARSSLPRSSGRPRAPVGFAWAPSQSLTHGRSAAGNSADRCWASSGRPCAAASRRRLGQRGPGDPQRPGLLGHARLTPGHDAGVQLRATHPEVLLRAIEGQEFPPALFLGQALEPGSAQPRGQDRIGIGLQERRDLMGRQERQVRPQLVIAQVRIEDIIPEPSG